MVRFKFFLFALLVLGLGAGSSPPGLGAAGAPGPRQVAAAQTTAAISEVARALESRRLAVQAAALKLAASPDAATACSPWSSAGQGQGHPHRGAAHREPLRPACAPPPRSWCPSRPARWCWCSHHRGALYARARGGAASDDKLDVQALTKAGATARWWTRSAPPMSSYSVPVLWDAEGGRSRGGGDPGGGRPAGGREGAGVRGRWPRAPPRSRW